MSPNSDHFTSAIGAASVAFVMRRDQRRPPQSGAGTEVRMPDQVIPPSQRGGNSSSVRSSHFSIRWGIGSFAPTTAILKLLHISARRIDSRNPERGTSTLA